MERGSIRGVFAPLASQGQVGERPAPGPIGRRPKGFGSAIVTLLPPESGSSHSLIGLHRQPEEIYAVDTAADPGRGAVPDQRDGTRRGEPGLSKRVAQHRQASPPRLVIAPALSWPAPVWAV